jgi:hypothetical protein
MVIATVLAIGAVLDDQHRLRLDLLRQRTKVESLGRFLLLGRV